MKTHETCPVHGYVPHHSRKDRKVTICNKCSAEAVTARRREIRRILVEEAGGKCIECGYNRSKRALTFHHRDPGDKAFELSNTSRGLNQCRIEAKKCDLLCANCHAESHDPELAD